MKKINTICVVEDDPMQVFIITKMIEMTQMVENTIVFSNGKDAHDKLRDLALANAKLPEIILLDLNMPIWDGWQFLDEFTKIPISSTVIIYILTSSNDPADLKRAETYNLSKNYLVKPLPVEQLKTVLAKFE
jgi:CheY-like chemotaxis protein